MMRYAGLATKGFTLPAPDTPHNRFPARHRLAPLCASIAMMLLVGTCGTKGTAPQELQSCPVVINEFMAKNTTDSILDQAGQSEDWIELYNTADTSFNLSQLNLSDDSTETGAYAFPDSLIQPRGYYVVWADDSLSQGADHAPFKIGATNGDELILSSRSGKIFDRISFFVSNGNPEARIENVSYGRRADGDTAWCRQARPTPGKQNAGL